MSDNRPENQQIQGLEQQGQQRTDRMQPQTNPATDRDHAREDDADDAFQAFIQARDENPEEC